MNVRFWIWLCLAILLGFGGGVGSQSAGAKDDLAASGSFRAAQDEGLDLSFDAKAFLAEQEEESPAAAGSFRAAQDVPPRVDWSRRLNKDWVLEPVLLNRRQAGQPQIDGDDDADGLVGIDLRKRF